MQRLDSMTLPELKKLNRWSTTLTIIGYLIIIVMTVAFLYSVLHGNPENSNAPQKAGEFIGTCVGFLAFSSIGFLLVFFRTRSARPLLLIFFSSAFLIMLAGLIVIIIKNDQKMLIGISITLFLPFVITIWTIITVAKAKCLFGPDAFSHRQIAEAKKKKKHETPFRDEELPEKIKHRGWEIFCLIFGWLGFLLLLATCLIVAFALSSRNNPGNKAGNQTVLNEETFQRCMQDAERGDASAQFILGRAYFNGMWVEKDDRKAFQWFSRSAEQGLPEGQAELGMCYVRGIGVTKDAEEGVKWIRKAVEKNNPLGQYNLALCYENGFGVESNNEEAVKYLRKAAEQGLPDAQAELGGCYLSGLGVTKDIPEALKWIRKAVDQGNAMGQFCLGLCYLDGTGVEEDIDEAVKLLRKAADQGLPDAQTELGVLYLTGTGVTKNAEEGVRLLRKAANQGDPTAKQILEQRK